MLIIGKEKLVFFPGVVCKTIKSVKLNGIHNTLNILWQLHIKQAIRYNLLFVRIDIDERNNLVFDNGRMKKLFLILVNALLQHTVDH